jgi:hypothetical protein
MGIIRASIDLPSGAVTSLYFVLIELFLERVLLALGNRANDQSIKRRLVRGESVILKENSIPIVTEGLVIDGFRAHWLAICLLRAAFLISLLLLNLGTNGVDGGRYQKVSYDFRSTQSSTDASWNQPGVNHYNRDYEAFASCQGPSGDVTKFYSIAVSMISKSNIDRPDFDPSGAGQNGDIKMKFSDLACLNGVDYTPSQAVFSIEGCGNQAVECQMLLDTPQYYNILVTVWSRGLYMDSDDAKEANYYTTFSADWRTWLNCLTPRLGGERGYTRCTRTVRKEPTLVDIDVVEIVGNYSAMFSSTAKGMKYNLSVYQIRKGATLRGGSFENITILTAMRWLGANKQVSPVELSGHIYAQSVKYERGPFQVQKRTGKKKVTEIDIKAMIGLGLAGSSFLFTFVLFLFSRSGANKVVKLRLNRLSGLSSMLREENSPTGACGQAGEPALVAIRQTGITLSGRRLHLGPVKTGELPCDMKKDDVLEGCGVVTH